jgi:hypothetical protein
MQFNRLSAFTLGVIITAASVGAVTYANAAGDATLKACANKTSGAMRYISKGSCKKTEKLLTWSQMGPQGLPGAAGAAGADGAKGDAGAAGTKGTNGTNGQNFHVIDAAGKDLGVALSSSAESATILHDGGIWILRNSLNDNRIQGDLYNLGWYSDSSCATPYWVAPGNSSVQVAQARGFFTSSGNGKYLKPTGTPFLGPASKFYERNGAAVNGVQPCREVTNSGSISEFVSIYFTAVVETTPPTFTAPFTIVAK